MLPKSLALGHSGASRTKASGWCRGFVAARKKYGDYPAELVGSSKEGLSNYICLPMGWSSVQL
jgi:hypothetical protein